MGVLLDQFGIGGAPAQAESWRYSAQALRALEQLSFAAADAAAELPAALIERFDWPEMRGRRIVFVNGAFNARHSNLNAAAFAIEHGEGTSTIRLGDGAALQLVFAHIPGTVPSRWCHDLAIEAASGSVELIEQHVGVAGVDVLGVLTSRLRVGAHAQARVTTLSDLPDSVSLYRREDVDVGRRSAYASTHALFGGRLQRFDLGIDMNGEQARYAARGVFAPRGRQHIDVHLDAWHTARDTLSDVVWRGVADQRGRGILHGAITVAAGADGADAQLQTKNLLLSPHAEIDAQPVLEIYTDEVKASHGATVGQLDERALFYLRSRGVPAAAARNLLIAGFCREAFALTEVELRTRLEAILAERLPQAAS